MRLHVVMHWSDMDWSGLSFVDHMYVASVNVKVVELHTHVIVFHMYVCKCQNTYQIYPIMK